jgi:hypothetical protein
LPLIERPVELRDALEVAFAAEPDPRLLVVEGRLAAGADARLEVDGEAWGSASGFPAAGGGFAAALPIAGRTGTARIAFAVRPAGPGVTLGEVRLVPAARVRFVIRDQGSKAPIPGIAEVALVDGAPPLPQGAIGGHPREGASWIAADGHGDLYVPHRSVATFRARSTPFRSVDVQRHAVNLRDGLLVTFLLSADQLPAGARILEAKARANVEPKVARLVDKARGIAERPEGFRVVQARDLLASGSQVVEQSLAAPDVRFLATNEAGARLVPPPGIVTVALEGGDLLHSNGPVILVEGLRREKAAVRAYVKVRLPAGVTADRLLVVAGGERKEHPLAGPSTVPLDVVVPPGTPIALVAMGPPASQDAPFDRAGAFRIIRAP